MQTRKKPSDFVVTVAQMSDLWIQNYCAYHIRLTCCITVSGIECNALVNVNSSCFDITDLSVIMAEEV